MDSTREVEEGRKLICLRTLGKESIHNSHSCPLSDLQADFWDEVIEFLNFYDQIRLLSVCKSFSNRFSLHFQLHRNDPINRLPWLIEFETSESNNFTFKLFDPIHKFPYKTFRIEQFSSDYIVSKHGWLLFLKQKRDEENDYSVAELFLVCPYTNEMIVLPDLITGFWNIEKLCSASHTLKDTCRLNHSHVQARATFTNSNPKSEECIFFVVYFAVDLHEITIFSYQKRNREEWKRNICSHPYFEYGHTSSITGIEYNQGLLYVLMKCGPHLWMFVYGHRHRPLVVFNVSFNAFRYFPDCVNVNLLVLDGLLHIAVSDVVLKKPGDNDVDDEYSMFVWNKSELFKFKDMVAREKKELGNRALFLGTASWDSAFVVEDMSGEELRFLGNRICFHEKCQETFDLSTNRGEIQRKFFVGGQEEPYRYRTMAWIQSPNHVKFSSSSSD